MSSSKRVSTSRIFDHTRTMLAVVAGLLCHPACHSPNEQSVSVVGDPDGGDAGLGDSGNGDAGLGDSGNGDAGLGDSGNGDAGLSSLEGTIRFLATFEAGSEAADVGNEFAQSQTGGSGEVDFISVVDNPASSQINHSDKVLSISIDVPGYSTRGEYHAEQLETDEKTYIYAWKELFPSDFGQGVDPVWSDYVVGQWKTYPCEVCADHADVICGGCGGIFNERDLSVDGESFEFRFRAEPDCDAYNTPMEKGAWHAFALEIYWTNSSSGYYNLYEDGVLIHSKSSVKTLFDRFTPGSFPDGCNVWWGMGLYMSWSDDGAGSLDYYLDDMAVFDVDAGATMGLVLEWQGFPQD